MKKFLFCFFYCLSVLCAQQIPFSSSPEEIGALSSDEDSLIGGIVSPLSGQVVVSKLDLIARGAQDIVMGRMFTPAIFSKMPDRPLPCDKKASAKKKIKHYEKALQHYRFIEFPWWNDLVQKSRGWTFLPHAFICEINTASFRVNLSNGAVVDFSRSSEGFRLEGPSFGMNNLSGETPDPAQDLRNIKIDQIDDKLIVYSPDGTQSIYTIDGKKEYKKLKGIRFIWTLRKEILPNGKVLRYEYGDFLKEKFFLRPKKIESLDPKEKYSYASVEIDGSIADRKCNYSSQGSDRVDYSLEFKKQTTSCYVPADDGVFLPQKNTFYFPSHMTSVSSPSYRHESISYNDFNQMIHLKDRRGEYSFSYEGSPYRITKLFRPCGEKGEMLPLYTIAYESPLPGIKGGVTTATRIDGSKVLYHFNSDILPTRIQWFSPEGVLKKEKVYAWDPQQRLKSIVIQGEQGILFQKEYEYDSFSNPHLEIIRGDLTGQGIEEVRSLKRTFSQDNRHLVLTEKNEEGLFIVWTYLNQTNLPLTQFTYVDGKLVSRQFWQYNESNELILKLRDNGSGDSIDDFASVTTRTAEKYVLRETGPFLHMPEWIESIYWDSAQEKLLKKTHLEYDKRGNIAVEAVYGSDNQFAYKIERTFDEQGNITSETNSLGQTSLTSFNPKGYPVYSLNSSKRLEKIMCYDAQNRLCELKEIGDKTTTHITQYKYKNLDQPVEEIDFLGNATKYAYDPVVSKATEVIKPETLDFNQCRQEVKSVSNYDALGREISFIDPNGYTTTQKYNCYGKPTLITYPDGNEERYIYFRNGNLKTAIDPEGNTTEYTYTPLGKLESKTRKSPKGEICEVETCCYESLQLKSSVDGGGRVTYYFYDGAGRKTSEITNGAVTEFSYDSLSRLKETKRFNGENTLVTITEYDLLNRKIEERKENLSGEIFFSEFYGYDLDGNKSFTRRWSKDSLISDFSFYDPFERLIAQENNLGKRTLFEYDENHHNPLNQRVLKKTETDLMGLKTIDIYNGRGEIASTEKRFDDKPLHLEEFYRDPSGNLVDQISTIYVPDQSPRSVHTHWEYNSMQSLELLVEAYGTPDQKKTGSTYNRRGDLFETIKPDGVVFIRTYDPVGRLKTIDSSDGTISYLYHYKPDGSISQIKDLNTGKSTHRDYDGRGRLEQEILANGLKLKTASYDELDRRLLFVLPDDSSIQYSYDPVQLKRVSRLDKNKKELYSHIYLKHDLAGHLLEEQPIGNLGSIHFDYDLLARPIEQTSPVVSYCVEKYDDNDNVLQLTTTNQAGSDTSHYVYDELGQLISEEGLFNNIYKFDSNNNRLQKNNAAYQINDLNQLLAADKDRYVYNDNGLPISKNEGQVIYQYDALDRLTELTIKDSKKLLFTYDALNRRLSKTVYTWESNSDNFGKFDWRLTFKELFLFDGQNEIGSVDSQGVIEELRILGDTPHAEIGAAIAMEFNGSVYTPLHDLHGNVSYLIDTSYNTIAASYRYSAFGEEKFATFPQIKNSWRFSSKRVDEESGLIYYGRRYYDPVIGRWLTPDPLGFADGMNLYAFVHNDPLTHFDEYGLLDYGQWNQTANDRRQSELGFNYGMVNSGFNAAWMGNALLHAPLAPFQSYDSKNYRFNWSMPNSFHSANRWLDQKHNQVNQRFFASADFSNSYFQGGSFGGQFVGDYLSGKPINKICGWVMNGVASAYGKLRSASSQMINYKNIFNNTSFQSFWGGSQSKKLLKLNEDNFRKNLIRYTGRDPGQGYQAHHVFPKSMRDDFELYGIKVHDPKYGAWWETTPHLNTAKDYNKKWIEFFAKTKDISPEQILAKGRSLSKDYGFIAHF